MILVKANLLSAQEELSDQNAWSAGFSGGLCSCHAVDARASLERTHCSVLRAELSSPGCDDLSEASRAPPPCARPVHLHVMVHPVPCLPL